MRRLSNSRSMREGSFVTSLTHFKRIVTLDSPPRVTVHSFSHSNQAVGSEYAAQKVVAMWNEIARENYPNAGIYYSTLDTEEDFQNVLRFSA